MSAAINSNSSDIIVSVIIPVHNSEKYLRECLTSVLSQTLRNIEVICVDTGNTNLCFDIIAEFQSTDRRILYIKDPNGSYGHKINVGIETARGIYIAILESDDQMSSDMLEKLYALAEEYRTDIVDADYYQFFCYKGKKLLVECSMYSQSEAFSHLMSHEENFIQKSTAYAIWTALYRRAFLREEEIRLNESPGASYQDVSFAFLTRLLAKRTYHLRMPLYQYRIDNMDSSVKSDKKIYEIIGEFDFLKKALEKRGTANENVWNTFYSKKYSSFYWNYRRLTEKSREKFIGRYMDELRADIENGDVTREMCNETLYNQTFLLLDDFEKFKRTAAESERNKPIEAVCEILDRIGNRELVVFGAGILGTKVLDVLQQNANRILCVCDNSERLHGTVLYGHEVYPVNEAVKKYPDACYLVVNRKHSEAMKSQLLTEGISEANIEIFS